MEGYGLPDMRQTECLRLFLVSFVPFVVGNMSGLNAYKRWSKGSLDGEAERRYNRPAMLSRSR